MKKAIGDYEIELTFDLPIEYKNLKIYPATIDNYYEFYTYVGCFFLEKNSIPDVRIIQMSYFEYLIEASIKEKKPYLAMLVYLLSMVLKIEKEKIKIEYTNKMKPILIIDGVEYDSGDFEKIKDIICTQNLVKLPDEKIQKEIRDKIQEAKRIKESLSGFNSKMGSLEDLIISIVISTGLRFEDVKKLTIRKFSKILQRLDNKIHYQIYLSASMSGLVEFKDKSFIKHWLTNLDDDNDENKDFMLDYDSVKSKIELSDKKK